MYFQSVRFLSEPLDFDIHRPYITRHQILKIGRQLLALVAFISPFSNAASIGLEEAIQHALDNDLWMSSNQQQQAAQLALSHGAATLPDPKFSVGLMNLPTDSFNRRQEGMTQIQLGVSQMLPRGESLQLSSAKLAQQSELMPIQRLQRRAEVRRIITNLWLEALEARLSTNLIEDNRSLFLQLNDIVSSSYSSALGTTRQQDIVRAQLELDQLDDRLTQLRQQQVRAEQRLAEWLNVNAIPALDNRLPNLGLPENMTPEQLYSVLLMHPEVRALDQKIRVAKTDIALANQAYKPEWMVNASYGIRDDDPMGNSRSDLFSIGVSVDIPIFSKVRQDAKVQAETHESEALKTQRLLLLRQLRGQYQALYFERQQLQQRLALYQQRLLPGLEQSAEAAINAYTADDGPFADVVQARISELNAKLTQLKISIADRGKAADIQYLLAADVEGDLR